MEFLSFLSTRPEKRIAVVSHSAFLARAFEKHLDWHLEDGPYRMENAAVRTIIIGPF